MEKAVNLKTEALKNGAIWGVISVAIFLVVWYTAPSLMSSYAYGIISLLIGIAIAVFFCTDMRKKAGGYWTFGEALWKIYAMFITHALILFVFTIIFGKFIDPSYPVKMKEMVIEKTTSMLSSMGMEESMVEETMQKTEADMEKQFNPNFGQAVMGFGINAILWFIGALIFALIFKRSNPNPWAPAEEEEEAPAASV